MPHLTLKYSNNIMEKDFNKFFLETHNLISNSLPTKLLGCRSRAMPFDNFVIGDGNLDNAFIHLDIYIKSGKSQELLQKVGNQILENLKSYLFKSSQKLQLQVSVEIREVGANYYN